MRTWETVLIATALAIALAPSAIAQESEPTVNESDFNTTEPTYDESYLNDSAQESSEDPTLSESEMDTTAPAYDESYLDEAEREAAGGDGASAGSDKDTPAAPVVAVLALAGLVALARRRA